MKELISWVDFVKVDLRVGTIIDVQDFPEAKKPAFKVKIDFGDEGVKQSSAQITDLYNKTDLMGKQIIAVINFPVKQIANFMSECLITGIVGNNNGVILLQPEQRVKNGLSVA
ncbi:UNVERIFIED_CONTAM: hypothetical protein GTU68_002868 [Idotea baltica]|nr:hypothetical protein [Idotea baltica]